MARWGLAKEHNSGSVWDSRPNGERLAGRAVAQIGEIPLETADGCTRPRPVGAVVLDVVAVDGREQAGLSFSTLGNATSELYER